VGRTFKLFDWSGVAPTGAFNVDSPLIWDFSQLYTTGEVTLKSLSVLEGDFNFDGQVTAADISQLMSALADPDHFKTIYSLTDANWLALADINGDGQVNNADLQALLKLLQSGGGSSFAVPEPAAFVLPVSTWAAFRIR
jgi:Dockerin type I domain